MRANAHVFSALIGQATRRLDYAWLHELLHQMHQLQVAPNDVIIKQLEFASRYPPTYDQVSAPHDPYLHMQIFNPEFEVILSSCVYSFRLDRNHTQHPCNFHNLTPKQLKLHFTNLLSLLCLQLHLIFSASLTGLWICV